MSLEAIELSIEKIARHYTRYGEDRDAFDFAEEGNEKRLAAKDLAGHAKSDTKRIAIAGGITGALLGGASQIGTGTPRILAGVGLGALLTSGLLAGSSASHNMSIEDAREYLKAKK